MNNILDEAIRVGSEANARALKPCPFCGGKHTGLYQEETADGKFIMYIECRTCGARGSVKYFRTVQIADIKYTWNDRADNFLDDYIFRGGTLREWVEKIKRGEIRAKRHGRWVKKSGNYGFTFYCSKCGEVAQLDKFEKRILSDFCPSCGAKMDGGKE